jgi:hypothetical protein
MPRTTLVVLDSTSCECLSLVQALLVHFFGLQVRKLGGHWQSLVLQVLSYLYPARTPQYSH